MLSERFQGALSEHMAVRDERDALKLEAAAAAYKMDTAKQDMERNVQFWCWERDAMLGVRARGERAGASVSNLE
jgi:hypothetical protein